MYKRVYLLILSSLLFVFSGRAQIIDHRLFDEIENLKGKSDTVVVIVESINAYRESGSLAAILRVFQEIHFEDFLIKKTTASLGERIQLLQFKRLALKDLNPVLTSSPDVFLRRSHNILFVDNFYLLQDNYYQVREDQENGELLLKQIDGLHDALSNFRDAFAKALEDTTGFSITIPALSHFLFDRFESFTEMAKKVADLRRPCTDKLNQLKSQLKKFEFESSTVLGNYITLLDDELRLLDTRMKEYDDFKMTIKAKEDEVYANGREQREIQAAHRTEDAAWQKLSADNSRLKNEIDNIQREIDGFRARIDELNRIENGERNRRCRDGMTVDGCVVHPAFVKEVRDNLRQIAVNKINPQREIDQRTPGINQRNGVINSNKSQMERLQAKMAGISQQLKLVQQKGMELSGQLRKLESQLEERKDWTFYESLRTECRDNKKLIENRKLFR